MSTYQTFLILDISNKYEIFFITKPTRCTNFTNLFWTWNSTCFGQFLCPSSGVYSLYTHQWYMSYRFVDSFLAEPGWNCVPSWFCLKAVWYIPLLSVQWINSWWWTEELSETYRVSWQNKFVKLVHLVGFIIKKFVTKHDYMSRCTVTCYDARSHVTMHCHMSRCTVTCHDALSHVTMHCHMLRCTVTCHDALSHVTMHGHVSRCTVTCHDARSRVTMHCHICHASIQKKEERKKRY